MTVTVVLSDCPQKLRGDMTKWFIEVNTGVYVGDISARVRDELWERIIDNLGHGHATMIFPAVGEQRMDFRVHNAYRESVDYDGIKLMRRPERFQVPEKTGFSTAAKRRMGSKKKPAVDPLLYFVSDYAVLDLETTGLDEKKDSIIEIALIVVIQDTVVEKKQILVSTEKPLPDEIVRLTGITEYELRANGIPMEDALFELFETVEDLPIVCHNAGFEQKFLCEACRRADECEPENRFIDTLKVSKLLLPDATDHKLSALAEYFGVEYPKRHRALPDCEATYAVYCKLNELVSANARKNED